MSECVRCGYCCKNLYLSDRIKISLETKSIVLSKKCKFLIGNNKCKIYNKRPNVCRKWFVEINKK